MPLHRNAILNPELTEKRAHVILFLLDILIVDWKTPGHLVIRGVLYSMIGCLFRRCIFSFVQVVIPRVVKVILLMGIIMSVMLLALIFGR